MRRVLLAGLLGSLVLLALWWRPTPPPPAWAQGVGIFSRQSCTTITNPVVGQTFCFDQSTNGLSLYTSSGWLPVVGMGVQNLIIASSTGGGQIGIGGTPNVGLRIAPTAASFSMPNGVNYTVNMLVNPTTSTALNQLGAAFLMTGGTTAGGIARIPLFSMVQSGNGASAGDQIEALNLICQQNAADIPVETVCVELDMNNNRADDVLDASPGHYGISLVNAGGKISGPAALYISNSSAGVNPWQRGVLVATGSIANGGFSFHARGDGTNGPFTVSTDSIVNVGQNVRAGMTAPAVGLANNRYYHGLSTTGTHQPLIGLSSSNSVTIDLNGNGVVFGDGASFAGGIAMPSGVTGGNFGQGTINIASATYLNGRAVDVATGSAGNFRTNVVGISASSSLTNNLRGTCTFAAAATCQVAFTNNEIDAHYLTVNGCGAVTSAKTRAGFLLTATGTNSNACDWIVVR